MRHERRSEAGLVAFFRALETAHAATLPQRQAEVLTLQAMGLENDEIADLLGLAQRSVESHAYHARRNVLPAAYAATRAAATSWAFLHRNCCLRREFFRFLGGGEVR